MKKATSTVSYLGLALTMLLTSLTSQAALLTWHLQNVTFDDGGKASGSFTVNTSRNIVTDVDITTTAGTAISSSFEYTSEAVSGMMLASTFDISAVSIVLFVPPPFGSASQRLFYLSATSTLLEEGTGTKPLDLSGQLSYENDFQDHFRTVTTGSISSAAPELTQILSLALGLAALLVFRLGANGSAVHSGEV